MSRSKLRNGVVLLLLFASLACNSCGGGSSVGGRASEVHFVMKSLQGIWNVVVYWLVPF